MRIASLTNSPLDTSLGSGKTVLAWSAGLREFGHAVTVVAPGDFHRPWLGGKARRLKMRLDALRLEKKLLAGDYDLIEFYGAEFGGLIQRLARIPRERRPLLMAHTNGLELLARAVPAEVEGIPRRSKLGSFGAAVLEPAIICWDKAAFSKVDGFAAICQADVDYVVRNGIQPLERCAVIEPGIDDVFLRSPWQRPKQPWLVSLGSWTGRKDPATTLRIVTRLLEQDAWLEFHVIGAGSARDAILSAFAPELRSRVTVHSRLNQAAMVEVLSQSKVLLFPSLYEGFGMAITEAMACGCAVVVTPTGFGSCIQDGVDGYVCTYRDVEAMGGRCAELLSNEPLRKRITDAGRARVEGLTWEAQVRSLETLYQQWLRRF